MKRWVVVLGIVLLLFLLFWFLVRPILWSRPRRRGEKDLEGGGRGGGCIPDGAEVPTTKTTLVNKRSEARALLVPKDNTLKDFKVSDVKVAPGEAYGVFDPQGDNAIVFWCSGGTKWTLLKVQRNGKTFYIAAKNAKWVGSSTIPQEGGKDFDPERIASQVKRLLKGPTPPEKASMVKDLLEDLSDPQLKAVAEAYERNPVSYLFASYPTLYEWLAGESGGYKTFAVILERLKAIGKGPR